MNNKKLTNKKYWNDIYEDMPGEISVNVESDKKASWWRRNSSSYSNYLYDCFIKKHMPQKEGLSIVEVGSAPGDNMVSFKYKYHCVPYGIEYAKSGAEMNKQVFEKNGIPSENVIETDFFDDDFQDKYRNHFDVVYSSGFIEHFSDPKDVVKKHINILKPGGTLIISIPNFRYLNFILKAFFNTSFIPTHNLELMDLDVFRECFNFPDFKVSECCYKGSFAFPQPTYTPPWKRFIEKVLGKFQLLINMILRVTFKDSGPESRYFSENLYCAGIKKIDKS